MRQACVLLQTAFVLLVTASTAVSDTAVLSLGAPRQLDGIEVPAGDVEGRSVELELQLGAVRDGAVEVTVAADALSIAEATEATNPRFPRVELAAPATGTLSGSGATTALRIDAQVRITWNASTRPQLYDVVLSGGARPDEPASGELEVVVEGWKVDQPSERPSFFAVLPAQLD
jgi:hypothetical protein